MHTYSFKKDQNLGKIFLENCVTSWIKSNSEKKMIVKGITLTQLPYQTIRILYFISEVLLG